MPETSLDRCAWVPVLRFPATLATWIGLAALLATGACGKDATGPGRVIAQVTISPANPTLADGATVQLGLTFRDDKGQNFSPTPAPAITWTSSDAATAPVSGSGLVTGERPGQATITASAAGHSTSTTVTVTAVATNLVETSGSGQTAAAGATLPEPLVVTVRDRHGNPVAGATVAFSVPGGGGSVSAANVTTAANGQASAQWTLGATIGTQTAAATVAGLQGSPVTFTATAVAGAAALMVKVSGDAQVGPPGGALPELLVVRVVDALDNPVQGAPVIWAIISGGGSLNPTHTTTDANGLASTAWTLGAAGTNGVLATGAGMELSFSATAEAAAPDCDEIVIVGEGGTLSGDLPSVRVTGNATVTGTTNVCGDLQIIGGRLTLNGQQVTVAGQFTLSVVSHTEALVMTNPADRLIIGGNASFAGPSQLGQLTAGEIQFGGNFSAGGTSGQAFASTGTRVVFNGTTAQTVSFVFPAPASQRFHDVLITNPAGIRFDSSVVATGDVEVAAGAAVQIGTDDTLRVSGNFTTGAGSSVTGHALAVAGTLAVSGSYTVSLTIFTGTDQLIPARTYQHVTISGVVRPAGAVAVAGNLSLRGPAHLTLIGQQVVVEGNMTLETGTELWTMNNSADRLIIAGNLTVNGASTEGRLTAGEIQLAGNFSAGGTSFQAFASSGTRVVFAGVTAQTVSFISPAPASQRFHDVLITNPAGVEFTTNAQVNGNLDLVGRMTVPASRTVTIVGTLFLRTTSVLNNNGTINEGACVKEVGHTVNGTHPCP